NRDRCAPPSAFSEEFTLFCGQSNKKCNGIANVPECPECPRMLLGFPFHLLLIHWQALSLALLFPSAASDRAAETNRWCSWKRAVVCVRRCSVCLACPSPGRCGDSTQSPGASMPSAT